MQRADKLIYQNTGIIDTRVIDYCLKCCMLEQKCKNNISGSIIQVMREFSPILRTRNRSTILRGQEIPYLPF
jgi:hypothetical protein